MESHAVGAATPEQLQQLGQRITFTDIRSMKKCMPCWFNQGGKDSVEGRKKQAVICSSIIFRNNLLALKLSWHHKPGCICIRENTYPG